MVGRMLLAVAAACAVPLTACRGDDTAADASVPSTEEVTPTRASVVQEMAIDRQMVLVPDAAVGEIANSEALVAVVPGDGHIGVYVCDGEVLANAGELGQDDSDVLSRWFRGSWDGHGPATLTSGPFTLTISGQDGAFHGELSAVTGERLPFTATSPSADGDGFYRMERYDPFTGVTTAAGDSIVFRGAERGAMHTQVTRPCRRVIKTVMLPDGTTTTIVVEICG